MGKEDESTKRPSEKHHRREEKSRRRDRSKERDADDKHKKRRKHDHADGSGDDGKHRKHKHHKRDKEKKEKDRRHDKDGEVRMTIVDDDADDNDRWVEKDITMDGERVLATDIPTAESLKITSTAEDKPLASASGARRDEWMFAPSGPSYSDALPRSEVPTGDSMTDGYGEGGNAVGVDLFSSFGTERIRKQRPDRPDPDKVAVSARELNPDIKEGRTIAMDVDDAPPPAPSITPGGAGSSWRMMRLRRVYETAEEEGRSIEDVGVERFGNLDAFQQAVEERRILDERSGARPRESSAPSKGNGRDAPTQVGRDGEKRIMFTEIGGSGSSSRSSTTFRRPGAQASSSSASAPPKPPVNRQLDSLRLPSTANSPLAQSPTPIPSVMTPPPRPTAAGSARSLSPSSLNKLQAKVIRAKLMGDPNAEKLEKEYEEEAKRSQGIDDRGVRTKVEVLPTLDAQGRLYDVGMGRQDDDTARPGNRKKKEAKFETHDRKTGEVIRINADDDEMTLGEMLRQERMGAGMADQKDLDAQYAKAIMGDGKFQNDLDYIDDNAEKLGRQKMRSDAMKRQFAINDYKRTQKALSTCNFCYAEDDTPPKAPIIASGTRVYLSCTLTEELVPGHCLIVPIQHHLNMLEGDDDVWEETKNFMKCLMRMFAEEDKGVVFYETVLSLKKQKHTVIECVPVPWEAFDLLPGYFKESIMSSEAEWSQHRKLIDFGARPGGFRRAMVPNLPYFMVQFDYKGEKGYGHVIEGPADAQDEDGLEEGEKGGGEFPHYFAGEIIGNVLEVDGRRWRRPKRIDFRLNGERVNGFRAKYRAFDWTGML